MDRKLSPRAAGERSSLTHEVNAARRQRDIYTILDLAPLPMAATEGATHVLRYANAAFCDLVGRNIQDIIDKPLVEILTIGKEFLFLLDKVYLTGKAERHEEQEGAESHATHRAYEMWPVVGETDHPRATMIQVIETAVSHQQVTAMNQALLVSSVRQHELADAAETLNQKLHAEIVERERTQEALVRGELLASAGRMAASIAHEMNNPLEAVINALYLCRGMPDLPDDARKYLDMAAEELMRVSHIVQQSLGFYRESVVRTSFSVSALIGSAMAMLQSKIKASAARVEQQCDVDIQVIAVFGELRQVLANLLANSLQAIEKDGRIVLRASTCHDPKNGARRIRLTIADSGRGIDAAVMRRLFEPFFTTKGPIGAGLGLWVCKRLVEKNGGSIRTRSATNGKHQGTTFSILLPGEPPPVAPAL
jgi:two-component system NtrC family sensor kinase